MRTRRRSNHRFKATAAATNNVRPVSAASRARLGSGAPTGNAETLASVAAVDEKPAAWQAKLIKSVARCQTTETIGIGRFASVVVRRSAIAAEMITSTKTKSRMTGQRLDTRSTLRNALCRNCIRFTLPQDRSHRPAKAGHTGQPNQTQPASNPDYIRRQRPAASVAGARCISQTIVTASVGECDRFLPGSVSRHIVSWVQRQPRSVPCAWSHGVCSGEGWPQVADLLRLSRFASSEIVL